jgi:hypothetical protein
MPLSVARGTSSERRVVADAFIPIYPNALPTVPKPSRSSRTASLVVNNLAAIQSAINRLLNRFGVPKTPTRVRIPPLRHKLSSIIVSIYHDLPLVFRPAGVVAFIPIYPNASATVRATVALVENATFAKLVSAPETNWRVLAEDITAGKLCGRSLPAPGRHRSLSETRTVIGFDCSSSEANAPWGSIGCATSMRLW